MDRDEMKVLARDSIVAGCAALTGLTVYRLPPGELIFQVFAYALAAGCLFDLLPFERFYGLGSYLARSGVGVALLVTQLEFGSGPASYRRGAGWFVVAAAFALQSFTLAVLDRSRERAAARLEVERALTRELAAQARHDATTAQLRTVLKRQRRQEALAGVVCLGLLLAQRSKRPSASRSSARARSRA